jgi:mono/diheme cytochrome c family protein
MAAFTTLSEAELGNVVAWLRTLSAPAAAVPPK